MESALFLIPNLIGNPEKHCNIKNLLDSRLCGKDRNQNSQTHCEACFKRTEQSVRKYEFSEICHPSESWDPEKIRT